MRQRVPLRRVWREVRFGPYLLIHTLSRSKPPRERGHSHLPVKPHPHTASGPPWVKISENDFRFVRTLGLAPGDDRIGSVETELYVGQQKILFDREATVALYLQTIMVPGADQCSCIPCKNFAAQRGTIFPETFLQFLNKLGADPLKEWEAFDYNFEPKNPRKRVLYGGWFLFVGELVEGLNKRPAPAQQGFAHWFTTSFPAGTLPTGLKLCAVEFVGEIPWVLSETHE